MSITNKIAQYRLYKSGVQHCTFNPDGPGVVRIHLIPPAFRLFSNACYIVILNGYYLLPLGYSWAVILAEFMKQVNEFDGKPISDAENEGILRRAVASTVKVYPVLDSRSVREDLSEMLRILFAVARSQTTDVEIEKLSLRSYSEHMTAPHRMDLLVSAMTDDSGKWKCNQKCIFCYAAGQDYGKTKELDTDEWKKAIDKLRKAGVPMLSFTGGEPTLRSDLPELIAYSKWFVTRLNTNGVNLTARLAEELRQASLDSVQVTLYSHSAEIHNQLVGCSHFDDTVNGIRTAVAAGLDVSVNTPICKKNADYASTLEFIHSLGVRYATCSGLICTGTAAVSHDDYDLTAEELIALLEQAFEYCKHSGMELSFTSPGLVSKERLERLNLTVPACGAALSNMAVAPDGTVVPCQSWLMSGSGLGNILTTSFADIWNNELCKKLRSASDEEALCCPFRKA